MLFFLFVSNLKYNKLSRDEEGLQMVKVDLFVYKDADKVLKEKGLFEEVKEILGALEE